MVENVKKLLNKFYRSLKILFVLPQISSSPILEFLWSFFQFFLEIHLKQIKMNIVEFKSKNTRIKYGKRVIAKLYFFSKLKKYFNDLVKAKEHYGSPSNVSSFTIQWKNSVSSIWILETNFIYPTMAKKYCPRKSWIWFLCLSAIIFHIRFWCDFLWTLFLFCYTKYE